MRHIVQSLLHKHANVPQIFAGRYEICANLVFPVQCHPIKKGRKKKNLRSRYYFKSNNCYEYRKQFSIKKDAKLELKINTTKYSRIFARTCNCKFFFYFIFNSIFFFQFENMLAVLHNNSNLDIIGNRETIMVASNATNGKIDYRT